MSSRDTWLNVLTGISQGSFDKIYLRDASGNMVDLLTLLGSLGSVTDVISNSSELVVTTNGTTKILTLSLDGYVTSTALTNALAAYTDTTALTTFLGGKAKYTHCRDWDLHRRGYHLLQPHAHLLTTRWRDTNRRHNIEFCGQQRELRQQRAERLTDGVAGQGGTAIQQRGLR